MSRSLSLVFVLALVAPPPPASAQTIPSGLEIARAINARDEGVTSRRHVTMELVDKTGHVRTREALFFRRYAAGEGESAGEKWIVTFFVSPSSIEGTAFLSHDWLESERDDEQWLYLPVVRRPRRIAMRDRGKSFLGTDLSFDDVRNETKVTLRDYTWKTLREDVVDDHAVWVVEATPVDADTGRWLGYGRVEFWVDREIWMVRKADYYDSAGRHLKTSHQTDIRLVDGIWTPHRVRVSNHRTGHRTDFAYRDVAYGIELPEDLFTDRALRRGPPR